MATTIEPSASQGRIASRLTRRPPRTLVAALAVGLGALSLWAIAGVGFVNYDTLYGLVWGGQLWRGETPQYELPVAPTPHPLVELLGVPLTPLGAAATTAVVVALAFIALAACGWLLYRLGQEWFGWSAGALAVAVFLTRVPVMSYGVRAYIDVPYVAFVIGAMLVETRRPHAGAPVLALLGLAGLLRPEAWAFSGVYWLYLALHAKRVSRADRRHRLSGAPRADRAHRLPGSPGASGARTARELAGLAALAAAAPALWIASDWLVTGHLWWSLTNTKHTARELGRVTGIANVPQYIPRRIGEVLRPPVLVGAALGGGLSLMWLDPRARLGAAGAAIGVAVFAGMAAVGLPIDTRYAFLAAAILCVFCGAGVFGWTALAHGDRRRRIWMAAGAAVGVALVVSLPGQIGSAHRELAKLARQQTIQGDLVTLVKDRAIDLECGPVGVPNHAPVPLLALYLKAAPSEIVNAQTGQIERGTYLDPASVEVEREYVLDPHDPHAAVAIPPGFGEASANRSWLVFKRCS